MKTTFDPEADGFYARFAPGSTEIVETREAAAGVMIDLDAQGHLVGLEVLSVRLRAAGTYGVRSHAEAAE